MFCQWGPTWGIWTKWSMTHTLMRSGSGSRTVPCWSAPFRLSFTGSSSRKAGSSRRYVTFDSSQTGYLATGSGFTFGYKAHVGVDEGSGLIRSLIATPANVNDTVPADALITRVVPLDMLLVFFGSNFFATESWWQSSPRPTCGGSGRGPQRTGSSR